MQPTKAEATGCRDVYLTCQLQWLIWWEGMGGTSGWQHFLVNAAATHPHTHSSCSSTGTGTNFRLMLKHRTHGQMVIDGQMHVAGMATLAGSWQSCV